MMTSDNQSLPDLSLLPPAPPYIHHWILRDASGDVVACGTDDGECAECHLLDQDAMDRFITGLVTVRTETRLGAVSRETLAKAA